MERKRILKAYGAEMVFTDPGEGSDGAIRKCREMYAVGSGPLLLSGPVQQSGQLEGAFRDHGAGDHRADGGRHHAFCGGAGNQRNLHGRDAADAARHAGREVLLGAAIQRLPRPGRAEAHAHGDRARAFTTTRWPTAISGSRPKTPIGWCGGWRGKKGCWWAFRRAPTWWRRCSWGASLHREGQSAVIVTMFCDSADKYLSEHFWDEE